MNVIVFEDNEYNNYYPLTLTRPVWSLRCGCFTQKERIERFIGGNAGFFGGGSITFLTRDYLKQLYSELHPGSRINDSSVLDDGTELFFINARLMPDSSILNAKPNCVYGFRDTPLFARIDSGRKGHGRISSPSALWQMILGRDDLNYEDAGDTMKADYIWDLIALNPEMIRRDYESCFGKSRGDSSPEHVTILGDPSLLYTGSGVRFEPGTVIDVSGGPVIIGNNTAIQAFTRIEGPCSIGANSLVLGARVREGCSIGDFCRVGGEIEESIFQGYSNKYHDGFIGHSYVGEWVNLGAMTSNSDLKNNYSPVKVYIPERRVQTGSLKVGCFIGDFCRTGIGTLINTGCSIGTGSMIVHSGTMTPFHVPPFTRFIGNELCEEGNFDTFLRTCETMMSRRQVPFSDGYPAMLERVHEVTRSVREKAVKNVS